MSLKQKEIRVPKTCHLLFYWNLHQTVLLDFSTRWLVFFWNKCQNAFMPGALSVWIFTSLFRADACLIGMKCVCSHALFWSVIILQFSEQSNRIEHLTYYRLHRNKGNMLGWMDIDQCLLSWDFSWSPPCRALSHTPSSLPINQTQHCKLLPGMVSSQAQLCRSNLELMQTIIQAAREVKKTCQKTFADMRWNCSSIDIPVDAGKYRPDLDRGMTLHFLLAKRNALP